MSTQSYVHGASDKQLIGQTIGRFFDDACARHAEREALVVRHQGVRLTYAQLKSRVDALACGLMRLGLEPGERIGIWSQNNMEWALTQFASAKAGHNQPPAVDGYARNSCLKNCFYMHVVFFVQIRENFPIETLCQNAYQGN